MIQFRLSGYLQKLILTNSVLLQGSKLAWGDGQNSNKPFRIMIRVAPAVQQLSRSNMIDRGVYVGIFKSMTPTESISRMHFLRTPAVIKDLHKRTFS